MKTRKTKIDKLAEEREILKRKCRKWLLNPSILIPTDLLNPRVKYIKI